MTFAHLTMKDIHVYPYYVFNTESGLELFKVTYQVKTGCFYDYGCIK